MRIIVDTCSFIWLCSDPDQLSEKAKDIINKTTTYLFISHASIWEMNIKAKSEKIIFPKQLRSWLEDQMDIWKCDWLPITISHILKTTDLPDYHKDPFDRLIIAQAKEENIPLLTPDKNISQYNIETIW